MARHRGPDWRFDRKFALFPVRTRDVGWIWLRLYWHGWYLMGDWIFLTTAQVYFRYPNFLWPNVLRYRARRNA